VIPTPLKTHGGKSYLAKRIVALMPPRQSDSHPDGYLHYVEPYAGGLSVLLANDPEGISEVVNDKNQGLINFWRVMKSDTAFADFRRRVEATPFSEYEFDDALVSLSIKCFHNQPCVSCAYDFFVTCRQSLAGRTKGFAPLSRTRVRRGMNEQASAWWNAVDGLEDVYLRLRRVVILGPRDGVEVVQEQDGPQSLFYIDCPYLHRTRTAPQVYVHEMTTKEHVTLLHTIRQCEGKVMISGYPDPLYEHLLRSWNRTTFDLPNNAAGGAEKKRMTEALWMNY
jgi:DNA adenine methylase